MSTEPVDPEVADQMRQQIRMIVREIEALARTDMPPAEFCEGYLARIVAAMAAEGGAVWMVGDGGRIELVYQINLRATQLAENKEGQEKHGRLLRKIVTSGQGLLAPPQSGNEDQSVGNTTDFLLVLAPLRNESEIVGVVEIFQRPGNLPQVERGYLRFLLQMADIGSDYLKTHRLRQYTERQAMWSQLEQFTRLVHRDLHPQETAYTIANEGRRLIECDRVSVATQRGSRYQIAAISGQEGFDRRSNVVTLLEKLTTVVARGGEPLWYSGNNANLAPQIESALDAYLDESHTKFIAILPLAKPQPEEQNPNTTEGNSKPAEILGALIIEQITEDQLQPGTQRRIEVVRDHSALALTNAVEHNSLFLMPVWRFLGKSKAILALKNLPITLSILCGIMGLLAALFLWPAELKLNCKGTLEPVVKRDVFAREPGFIYQLSDGQGQADLAQGQNVVKDQVLLQMRSEELMAEISATNGEIDNLQAAIKTFDRSRTDSTTTTLDRVKLEGEKLKAQAQIDALNEKLQILREKQSELQVTAPQDGIVTTWDVRGKLLNRPVERGQKLLTLADPTGGWELILQMPDDKMGHLLKAKYELAQQNPNANLVVKFILATHPGVELEGVIKEIHTIAEVQGEAGNMVQLKVQFDQAQLAKANITDLRPGATVTANVLCGKTSLGYAWFHEVIAFVQSRVLFRFF